MCGVGKKTTHTIFEMFLRNMDKMIVLAVRNKKVFDENLRQA